MTIFSQITKFSILPKLILIWCLFINSSCYSEASLDFSGDVGDLVDFGSAASVDDLDPFTIMFWAYPTSFVSGRNFSRKSGNLTDLSGTGGDVRVIVSRATTNTNFITNDTPLSLNVWNFVAFTFDSGAAAGEVGNIYVGDTTTAAAESSYGTATDGSGAIDSDASASLILANRSAGGRNFPGSIAFIAYINRVLTLDEIISQQWTPHVVPDTKIFSFVGFAGTGTQLDFSGLGNNGTVTGTSASSNGPPIKISTGGGQ